jgi:hypothetical protein
VFTKALTIKLAQVAPDLIHPNQAGFVPGRQIRDHIWPTKRVIELAEATERDGVIVALDQEKAYDKVEHDYLWRALTSYGIPQEFINTIKALYSDAHTYVCVNGEMSNRAFKVTRGVRQGDPLSSLIFDLAIEPLAESLRQSNLKGFKIRDKQEKLISTLLADDTLVYLDASDDFGALMEVLDEWCVAAGAKFNISKTEMIPIGKIEHRDRVRAARFINGITGTPIPGHIKISAEGGPIRTLGAWVGNGVDQVETWARSPGPLGTWSPVYGRPPPHSYDDVATEDGQGFATHARPDNGRRRNETRGPWENTFAQNIDHRVCPPHMAHTK